MKNLFYKLTGGRPMVYKSALFTDFVSGLSVNHYVDKFGRNYMANHSWSWFRVEKKHV